MEITDIEIDQRWYIRRPGATALSAVVITDVTGCTVEVRDDGGYSRHGTQRYVFDELEFIEAY